MCLLVLIFKCVCVAVAVCLRRITLSAGVYFHYPEVSLCSHTMFDIYDPLI